MNTVRDTKWGERTFTASVHVFVGRRLLARAVAAEVKDRSVQPHDRRGVMRALSNAVRRYGVAVPPIDGSPEGQFATKLVDRLFPELRDANGF